MRSQEFIAEGVDTSPADVKKNHPDIFKFITNIAGLYSIENAKVQSFDLDGTHHVVVEIGPVAGIRDTLSIMKDQGIKHNFDEVMNAVKGQYNGLSFTIEEDHVSGNKTQIWTFIMDKEAVQEAGTELTQINALSSQMKKAIAQGDKAAYKAAEAKLNAISDKLQAEQGLQETDFEQGGEPVKPKRKRRENPFGPMHYDAPSFGQRPRNTVRDVDDGSRGLSNRDRNK